LVLGVPCTLAVATTVRCFDAVGKLTRRDSGTQRRR
jgi:hypothetical protein